MRSFARCRGREAPSADGRMSAMSVIRVRRLMAESWTLLTEPRLREWSRHWKPSAGVHPKDRVGDVEGSSRALHLPGTFSSPTSWSVGGQSQGRDTERRCPRWTVRGEK